MVVGFTTTYAISAYLAITTNIVRSNPADGEVYSTQYYAIKFVSDLRQVGGFLQFPPPIKLMAVSFIGGGNWRKPPTCLKSLTNFIA
jgi:hypothetical protein